MIKDKNKNAVQVIQLLRRRGTQVKKKEKEHIIGKE
jgi:hypothetical protein